MTPLKPILALLLMTGSAWSWGQSLPAPAGEALRPLNLSLPREETGNRHPSFTSKPDDVVTRKLQPGVADNSMAGTARQPYGSGYENRQRAGNGGFSSQGGGRGGMGRGQ